MKSSEHRSAVISKPLTSFINWISFCSSDVWSYDFQLYSDPNIVIAKMDATANDVPQGYDVQGHVFKFYITHQVLCI